MTTNITGIRAAIRYSEAFKMSVVQELEASGLAFSAVAVKYGIKVARRSKRGCGSMAMALEER